MMKATQIRWRDRPSTPWANGGGRTRELLAWPSPGAWRLRVSVADIEADGPFSAYPGVRRWFAVLQGGGIALTIDGAEHACEPGGEPVAFAGEAAVSARRRGAASRDLNLMVRGGRGAMHRARAGAPWQPGAARWGLFTLGPTVCRLDGLRADLPAETLLWVEGEAASVVAAPLDDGDAFMAWWLAVDLPADGDRPVDARTAVS